MATANGSFPVIAAYGKTVNMNPDEMDVFAFAMVPEKRIFIPVQKASKWATRRAYRKQPNPGFGSPSSFADSLDGYERDKTFDPSALVWMEKVPRLS